MPESVVGPYQILGQLGAGGMGEVYRALDTRVGRHVALKILPESLAQETDRRRRFEQEARLAASLNHPNVMAIYDVGLDQHPPYIVGELVPGESLRALIDKGPLAPRKAVDIAAQIAAGLAAAHTAGIVHRDLKPENVIVTPEGSAKILDFGVARMETRSASAGETVTLANTSAGSVIGTAAYMSPEQARAEDVDYRSDQFALGLVLYEMLTGKQPFARPSAVETMSAIIQDDTPPVERPIPAQLRWIVERCLAKERAGRYESTRDLARELAYVRDHFSEVGVVTGQQPALQPAAKTALRRSVRPVAVFIGVVAGAVIAWCAAAMLSDPGGVDLSKYTFTPFATALAMQGLPSWSPDGKSIAFLGSGESDPTRLWVQAAETSNAAATAVAVTSLGANVVGVFPPIWSPDSRSLYVRCSVKGASAICRVPAGGGEPIVVQEKAMFATLSPDGRTLVTLGYSTDALRPVLFTATPPDGPRRPYEPEPPLEGRQAYNNPLLAFSPDGAKILFLIALEGRGETSWLLPWPPGKSKAVFAPAPPFAFTPQASWLPDSRHFVFAGAQLNMADSASGRYWPVLAQDRGAGSPTVSPDGSRLAYESDLSHSDVIAVPVGDGPVRTLISSLRSEQMPDASPVAPQLVYVTNRRGPLEIWLTNLASSSAGNAADNWDRPLLRQADLIMDGEPAQFFMNPVFSPDGRRIAFGAKGRSGLQVYTAFTSGGAPVRVTHESGVLENAPAWSPDGKWLAFERETSTSLALAKVQPGSGMPPVDLGPIAGHAVPEWSPDGEWIASHDDGGLVLIDSNGKQTRRLPGDGGPVAWSRDGKTLYQVHINPPALFAIDIASGKDRKLRDLPGFKPFTSLNPGLKASLTADGKDIVYCVNHPRREIWILDGIQTPKPWYARLLGR